MVEKAREDAGDSDRRRTGGSGLEADILRSGRDSPVERLMAQSLRACQIETVLSWKSGSKEAGGSGGECTRNQLDHRVFILTELPRGQRRAIRRCYPRAAESQGE